MCVTLMRTSIQFNRFFKAMLVKMSLDQLHAIFWKLVRNSSFCRPPHIYQNNSWVQGEGICVWPSSPDDSKVCKHVRCTGVKDQTHLTLPCLKSIWHSFSKVLSLDFSYFVRRWVHFQPIQPVVPWPPTPKQALEPRMGAPGNFCWWWQWWVMAYRI